MNKLIALLCMMVFLSCASQPEIKDKKPLNGKEAALEKAKATFERVQEEEEGEIEIREAKPDENLEKRIDMLYDKAYEAYLSGQFERAITSFESARLLNSDKMFFWQKRALSYCYIATGRYKQAEKLALSLVKEKSDFWGAYMNVAMALLWQGKVKRATEYFLKAEEFKDAEPSVHFYLGVTLDLRGQPKNAAKHIQIAENEYKEIIAKNPNDEQAFFELAYLLLYKKENLKKVESLLSTAKDIIEDSDNVDKKQRWLEFYLPHLGGILAYQKGEYNESIFILTDAIEKAPSGLKLDLAEIYYYLGKNYLAMKKKNKAVSFFNKALELDKLILYANDIAKAKR